MSLPHLARRLFVTGGMITCLVGGLLGSGVLGRDIDEQVRGALQSDATLIAPASPAFSIWFVIWLGFVAYTVWQWLPSSERSRRPERVHWIAGSTLYLNGAFTIFSQFQAVWPLVVTMALLVPALIWLLVLLHRTAPVEFAERFAGDHTFGLYLGWSTVALLAMIAAALTMGGYDMGDVEHTRTAIAMLVAAVVIGLAYALTMGARLSIAVAISWGLAWISYNRLTLRPYSSEVGTTAAIGAAVVLASTALLRGLAPLARRRLATYRSAHIPSVEPAAD